MGEIAEAMLDGSLCQDCGEYVGDGPGYPVTCAGCGGTDPAEVWSPRRRQRRRNRRKGGPQR